MEISEFQRILKNRYLEKDRLMGELFMLSVLTEEVGELAKAIRYKNSERIAEELGDVVFVAFCISNLFDIDMERCLKSRYVNRSFEEVSKNWKDVSWKNHRNTNKK
ncbi:nucleotide pyrophosphohydrolase [Methanosarcinales archaeon]|nr:MAG: nucleotide pyrophosphohydrolase [Methanosarcinales archaeon]